MSMQMGNDLRGIWNDVDCDRDNYFSYVCSMDLIAGSRLPVVFDKIEESHISNAMEVGVLPYLGKQFEITFKLYLKSLPSSLNLLPSGGWASVLQFTKGRVCAASAIDGNG